MENDETKKEIPRSPVIEAPVSEVTLYILNKFTHHCQWCVCCSVCALLVYMHVHQKVGVHACTLVYMHFYDILAPSAYTPVYTHLDFRNNVMGA